MIKGRKTTQEERAEIVAFCIEHGKDYGVTVETNKVSYQQIYAWVRKYEENGVKGLTDRRGKAKTEDELTEEDRLRQENKILQAKITRQTKSNGNPRPEIPILSFSKLKLNLPGKMSYFTCHFLHLTGSFIPLHRALFSCIIRYAT